MTGTIRADRRDVMEEMISQIKKISEGIATPENKGTFGLHSDHFVLEERVIPEVAAVFAQFALSYLNAGGFAEEKV